jgi:Fe-S cluster assembly protein SufD
MRKTASFLRSVSSLSSNKAPQVTKEEPPISIVENFFKEILSSKSQPTSVTSTLSKLRLLGSSLLSETPYPKLKDEAWRFTNVNGLFAPLPISNHWKLPSVSLADIEPYLDSNSYHVVFIDGVFSEHLSSKDIMYRGSKQLDVSVSVFKDLDALPVSDEEQLCHVPQHKVLPRESYGSDILTMINMARTNNVIRVNVQKGVNVTKPIQLLFGNSISNRNESIKPIFPKILVQVEENSSLELRESYVPISPIQLDSNESESSNFICSNVRSILKTNSSLRHSIVQEISNGSRHCEVVTAQVSANSRYDLRMLQTGSMQSRINVHVNLTDRLSNCSIFGAALSGSNQLLDVHSEILHNAAETFSVQKQNVLLGELGRAVFKGLIRIPAVGQKSSADQQCRSIMLGEKSRFQANPALEITANDVVCSHGAAMADVDPNALFCLAARGVNYQLARQLLTKSFIFSMLNDVVIDENLKKRITDKILFLSPKMFLASREKNKQ